MTEAYDLITIGRISMDLFAEQIGVPFVDIQSFETSVGGSPMNIAIGSSRLGLEVAALTAVGEDKVGDFVLRYLQKEGVDTRYIPRKANARTGLAVLGIQPPDKFPLVFYRENPADIHLTIDDVQKLPIAESRALLLSGTALSRGAAREATLFAAETAQVSATTTFIDLDLRPDQWAHPLAYGTNIRRLLPLVDIIIGTEEECYAALSPHPEKIMGGHSVNDERREVERLIAEWLAPGYITALILKRGAEGVTVYTKAGDAIHAEGFPVTVLNTVGAGDAFASGFIYAFLQGWDWYRCARMANACGAIVVTRHGCSQAMPTQPEVLEFMKTQGATL